MSLVGYVRVSSLDQDTTTQLERVTAANCKKVFSEKESGTSTKQRTALAECLNYLREGDSLVITKIDRLARSARDLHNLVHDLEQRHIGLLVLDQSIDTSTPHGQVIPKVLSLYIRRYAKRGKPVYENDAPSAHFHYCAPHQSYSDPGHSP